MYGFVHLDLERVFHSPRFIVLLLIGIFVCVTQYVLFALPGSGQFGLFAYLQNGLKGIFPTYPEPGTMYPILFYENWIGGEWLSVYAYIYFMGLSILACGTFGDSAVIDRTSGYIKNLFIRGEKKNYYMARFVSAFLTGGIVVVVPLLINILLCMATLPNTLPQAATGTGLTSYVNIWVNLYYFHPMLYIFIFLIIIFVFSGLLSAFSCALGMISDNRIFALLFPFIVYLFLNSLFSAIGMPELSPFIFLSPSQRSLYVQPVYIAVETAILFVITAILYFISYRKDDGLW